MRKEGFVNAIDFLLKDLLCCCLTPLSCRFSSPLSLCPTCNPTLNANTPPSLNPLSTPNTHIHPSHTHPHTNTQVCAKVFGSASGLVDMIVSHVPSSKVATASKVARLYTGPQDPNSPLLQFMTGCSRSGGCVCV